MSAPATSLSSTGRRPWSGFLGHPAFRQLEHDLLVFRRGWHSYVVSGMSQPFLYLLSMGAGLGLYVNRAGTPGGVSYLEYIAPALLVTQAMMAASAESAWPIMSKILWDKTYLAALNTPLSATNLLSGDLLWIGFRAVLLSVLFFAVILLFGAVSSPLAVLAVPVAVLTALAFAAPIVAFTATQRSDQPFNMLFRFGITPLFLFSGTFFPIERLPLFLQPLAWATPLYHGISLARGFALGQVDPMGDAVHLAVLVAFVVAGVLAARVAFRRRLEV